MKRTKQLIIVLGVVVLGIGGSIMYNQFKSNDKEENNNAVQDSNIRTVIQADEEFISLEDGIKESDLVVEVEILGKDREEGADDESVMPQTIHSAQILEIFSGELTVGDIIYVLQDGVEGRKINNIPIYQAGEKYIFILNAAQPEDEYPNTYWATKKYFSTDDEVVDLNLGDAEFDETIDFQLSNEEAQRKTDEVVDETFVDEVNVQTIKKSIVLDKIAEVIEHEKD